MAGMIFLGLVLAGLAGYLVYALVYPEKLSARFPFGYAK